MSTNRSVGRFTATQEKVRSAATQENDRSAVTHNKDRSACVLSPLPMAASAALRAAPTPNLFRINTYKNAPKMRL